MHVVILTLMLAITNTRGTETPSLIADLEFEICSGSAERGKPMRKASTMVVDTLHVVICHCCRCIKVKCTMALGPDETE